MAKELMEIGGFITSGAEIVNHDASLSGNGTVDSPLGVVPGYNETVLYSGTFTASSGSYFSVSESVNNFEKISFQYGRSPDSQAMSEQTFITNANGYNLFYIAENTNSTQVNLYAARLLYTDNNLRFTVNAQVVKTIENTSLNQNTTSQMTITKIIGINRIANN